MFILTDKSKVVLHISDNDMELVSGDKDYDSLEKWKVNEFLRIVDSGFTKVKVTKEVPKDFQQYKYCYDEVEGAYLNSEWVEPPKPVEVQLEEIKLAQTESELEIDERISRLELGLA